MIAMYSFLMVCLPFFTLSDITSLSLLKNHESSILSVSYANTAPGTVFINNPIRAQTITELLLAILRIFMVIAVPIIIFFIVYAGFLYVTARGNSEQIQTANRAFTYAIIGGLIILGAVVLVGIIQNLVSAFGVDVDP